MIRLYEEVVGRGGISPDYFFDSMTFSECAAFIRGMNRKEQEAWGAHKDDDVYYRTSEFYGKSHT